MIEFINSLDSTSVFIGMAYSYFVGTVVSVINYYTEKAIKLREERKRRTSLENGTQARE